MQENGPVPVYLEATGKRIAVGAVSGCGFCRQELDQNSEEKQSKTAPKPEAAPAMAQHGVGAQKSSQCHPTRHIGTPGTECQQMIFVMSDHGNDRRSGDNDC